MDHVWKGLYNVHRLRYSKEETGVDSGLCHDNFEDLTNGDLQFDEGGKSDHTKCL